MANASKKHMSNTTPNMRGLWTVSDRLLNLSSLIYPFVLPIA